MVVVMEEVNYYCMKVLVWDKLGIGEYYKTQCTRVLDNRELMLSNGSVQELQDNDTRSPDREINAQVYPKWGKLICVYSFFFFVFDPELFKRKIDN